MPNGGGRETQVIRLGKQAEVVDLALVRQCFGTITMRLPSTV